MAGASENGSKQAGELFAELVRKPSNAARLSEPAGAASAGTDVIAALTSKSSRRSVPPPPPNALRVLTPLPMIAVGASSSAAPATRVKPPTPPRPPPSECTDPTLNIEPDEIFDVGIAEDKRQGVRPAAAPPAFAPVASQVSLKAPTVPRPPRPSLPKTRVEETTDATPTQVLFDLETDDENGENTEDTPTHHLGKLPLSALCLPQRASAAKLTSLPPLAPGRRPSVPPPVASRNVPSVPPPALSTRSSSAPPPARSAMPLPALTAPARLRTPLPAVPSLPPLRTSASRSSMPPVSSPPRSSINVPRTTPTAGSGNHAMLPPPRSEQQTLSEIRAMRPRLDTSPSARAPSIAPVAYSTPSVAPVALSRRPRMAAVLGIAAGLLLGVPLLLANTPVLDALAGSGSSLVITVSGPGNTLVSALSVVVDDVARCETSPCRVTGLEEGSHFVKIVAPGYEATAPRAVALRGSDDTLLNVEVARSHRDAPASREPVSAEALPVLRRSASGSAARSAPAARRNPTQPSEREPRTPVAAKGSRMTINSIPASTVVLDGRPMGMTPLVGISVNPGTHSVIFVHPEHGRKTASVSVEPGTSRGVSVRF